MAAEMEKAKRIRNAAVFTALELALYLVIFHCVPLVKPLKGTKVFLALLSLAAGFVFSGFVDKSDTKLIKYRKKTYIIPIILTSLYASLASFAQRFFFEGYSRMHLSLSGIVCCILAVLWFVPVICLLLWCMERLSLKGDGEGKGGGKFFLLCLAVYTLWQIIVLMAFRPGGFPPDSVSQLFQAIGYERIYDWHPALHTLYFRLIMKLGGNRAVLINAVQMLAFAALVAGFASFFVKKGLKKVWALLGGLAFLMLPANVLSEVSAVKDFPYAMSLLWATLCLVKLAADVKEGSSLANLAQLATACFLVFGFRHNGVIPAAFIIILLIVLTVKFFAVLRYRLLLTALAAAAMMIIYKGPIFAIFDVAPNTASPYTTMLCAVGSCVNQGLPLSDESVEILESVIPLEDWGKYYSRYEGHDKYNWGRGEDATFNTEHITAKMAFRVYLEALFKYPDVVIKDRLDGMDIMWDVHRPTDSFNEKSFDTIYFMPYSEVFFNVDGMEEKGWNQYAVSSKLADAYRETKNYGIYNALDMLTWRTGAYIIFMLAVLIYICAGGKKRLLWAAVPLGGNIFGLLFLLYHQSFRYVYALQPMIIALALAAVIIKPAPMEKAKGDT